LPKVLETLLTSMLIARGLSIDGRRTMIEFPYRMTRKSAEPGWNTPVVVAVW
jgi:hypothetical protein